MWLWAHVCAMWNNYLPFSLATHYRLMSKLMLRSIYFRLYQRISFKSLRLGEVLKFFQLLRFDKKWVTKIQTCSSLGSLPKIKKMCSSMTNVKHITRPNWPTSFTQKSCKKTYKTKSKHIQKLIFQHNPLMLLWCDFCEESGHKIYFISLSLTFLHRISLLINNWLAHSLLVFFYSL